MKKKRTALKFRLQALVLTVMMATTLIVPTSAANVQEGRFRIASGLGNNLVLDVNGNNSADGTNIQVYTANGTTAQDHELDYVGNGWYRIIHVGSGKVLDVSGGVRSSQVNVWLYSWNGTDAQLWRFISDGNGGYYIQNKLGYYLDVQGGVAQAGTNVWVYSGNKSAAQVWYLKGAETTMYVRTSSLNNKLNMRSSPSTSASVVTKLSFGTPVKVLSSSNGWAKVTANGKTGYVSTQYLTSSNPIGGAPIKSSALVSPVPAGAKFNRKTNDNGWYGYHDINRNVSTNTPVYAVTDGVAEFYQYHTNGKLRSYGNVIKFTSSDGVYKITFAHLSRFNGVSTPITADSAYPCSGARTKALVATRNVSAGDILGYIGTTGNSSGVHLHIEVYKNGVRVDPTTVFSGLV